MRLACENEQNGAVGIVDQPREALPVTQQQRRALVRGEAASEADRENVRSGRIEEASEVAKLRETRALAPVFTLQSLPNAGEHP